jgi:Protein of unknown function (DUF4230)
MADINIDPYRISEEKGDNNRKQIFIILGGIALLIVTYFTLRQLDIIPDIKSWFTKKEIKIDETPLIILRIRELAEMTTVTAMDEVVVTKFRQDDDNIVKALWENPSLNPNSNRLTLIIAGKIKSGIDLKLLQSSDIKTNSDSITMYLPKARLLDVIVNPSDVKVFIEKGNWTNSEVLVLTNKGKEKIKFRAYQQKIIERADLKAKAVMESLLRNLGFKTILIYSK